MYNNLKMSKKFINDGYLSLKGIFDRHLCQKLNRDIKKIRKINRNTFLSKKEYLFKQKENKNNILDKFNLDFILKNNLFLQKIKLILGDDFEIYAKRIICGVPHSYLPKWISAEEDLNSINVGKFIKPKFRDLRYFHGIDYHQDMIDFPKEECKYITVYIYLDKVTKKMSPLNLLTGTHKGGPSIFPHNLKFKKKIIYKTDEGKLFYTKNKKLIGNAGDAWIWHCCLLHGTQVNLEKKPRFSLRLILKQKKKNKLSLMTKTNNKIKNIVSFKKMLDFSKYKVFKSEKRNITMLNKNR